MLIGAWLRLRALSEMELKGDEKEALRLAVQLITDQPWSSTAPWPTHGMPSSNGIGNAPLFTWLVAAVWAVFENPVWVARLIAIANVACLYPLWRWARRHMSETAAVLTLAIAAVSPFGVMYSRKIWTQDLLCIGVVLVLWGIEWLRGARPWRGVALLLLAGLFLGQLHQSGAIAFALLPIAMALQWLVDRARGRDAITLGRPSPLEIAAIIAASAAALFFWIPYAAYLSGLSTEVLAQRPKLPSLSNGFFQEVFDQVRPVGLFDFFRHDRDDFMAGAFRRVSFQASVFLGTPLLVYGMWRWLKAPHTLPVIGFWWLIVIAVFSIARIPTHIFYVLVLMPLPVVLASGALDGRLPQPIALALLVCRIAYTACLLALTVTTQSWLFGRGGANVGTTGGYGVSYSVRLVQAKAIVENYRRDRGASFEPKPIGDEASLECRDMPVEVEWLVSWLDGDAAAAVKSAPILLCDGFVGPEGGRSYRWFLRR